MQRESRAVKSPYNYGFHCSLSLSLSPLATHQFPRSPHILCILSSTVSPPALNSFAGTSSAPVALRLAVWRMARATSERSGGGCSYQFFPFLITVQVFTSFHQSSLVLCKEWKKVKVTHNRLPSVGFRTAPKGKKYATRLQQRILTTFS